MERTRPEYQPLGVVAMNPDERRSEAAAAQQRFVEADAETFAFSLVREQAQRVLGILPHNGCRPVLRYALAQCQPRASLGGTTRRKEQMELVHERCCGLDVHKRTVLGCIRTQGPRGGAHKEVKTFSTMTFDLLILRDWLAASKATHVATESAGVHWKPIFNLLEDQFNVLLVHAAHIKTVPGRKTNVKDCEWMADLRRPWAHRAKLHPTRTDQGP